MKGDILDRSFPPNFTYLSFHELFNVIYRIRCSICHQFYVGETSLHLNIRINNHRSDIKRLKNSESAHFQIHPFDKSFIDILAFVPNTVNRVRLETKLMFVHSSIYPYGMNDRFSNYNIMDSLHSTCIFSLFSSYKSYDYRRKVRSNLRGVNRHIISFSAFFKKIDISPVNQYDFKIKYFIAIIKTTANKFLLKFLHRVLKKDYKFKCARIQHLIIDLIKFKLGLFSNPVPIPPVITGNSYLVLPFSKFFSSFDFKKIFFSPEIKDSFPSSLKYPKITYRLDLPFSKRAFNYREFGCSLPVANDSVPCFCSLPEYSKFVNPYFNHIVSGDLDLIQDPCLKSCFSKGTKFRPVFPISKFLYFKNICNAIKSYIIKYSQIYGIPFKAFDQWFVLFKSSCFHYLSSSSSSYTPYKFKSIMSALNSLKDKFIISTVDKASNNYSFICKKLYTNILSAELNSDTFESVSSSPHQLVVKAIKFSSIYSIKVLPSFCKLPFFFAIPKFHKNPVKFRFITSSVATAYKDLAIMINCFLDQLLGHISANHTIKSFIISNSSQVINDIKNTQISSLISYDFTTLYTNIDISLLLNSISKLIDKFWPSDHKFLYHNRQFSKHDFLKILTFSLENNYIDTGVSVFRQSIGIPMGASYSVNLANLFLFYYEDLYLSSYNNISDFNLTFRYIDDLLVVNFNNISNLISEIYPSSLLLELSNHPPFNSVNYLDLNISIGSDFLPIFKLFDKRSLYSFKILGFPHISSNIPEFIAFNTFSGQTYRYFSLCHNNLDDFILNLNSLVSKFINNGFHVNTLWRLLVKLKFRVPPIRPFIHAFFRSNNVAFAVDKDVSFD